MEQEGLQSLLVGMRNDLKESWQLLTKQTMLLPYSLAVVLIVFIQRSWKVRSMQKLFVAALIIIAKTWKWFRCPLRWVSKLWYMHTVLQLLQGGAVKPQKRHGGPRHVYFWAKEASLKRLHTIWFHPLHDSGKGKTAGTVKRWVFRG